ncbi:hypothetical protein [Streptomyces sp. NBRC 110465]|uniref:hypothetical protein n=1 Tax=Streptomyces sp. NBRC 110465 TaxID=1897621 RepID=UPI0009346137|nr:hypothetical protein [Streptomyces sp. NBRC 110465]
MITDVEDDACGHAHGAGDVAKTVDAIGLVAARGAFQDSGSQRGADDDLSGEGQQPVDRGGDLGQYLGHLAAGLGGSDPFGEIVEVAPGSITVSVRDGEHVEGWVEVDVVVGGEQRARGGGRLETLLPDG